MGNFGRGRAWREPVRDHHVPAALLPEAERPAARGIYHPADPELELACPGCTLIWAGDRWAHEPSCMFRRSRPL